jgi:hypothetical protein
MTERGYLEPFELLLSTSSIFKERLSSVVDNLTVLLLKSSCSGTMLQTQDLHRMVEPVTVKTIRWIVAECVAIAAGGEEAWSKVILIMVIGTFILLERG